MKVWLQLFACLALQRVAQCQVVFSEDFEVSPFTSTLPATVTSSPSGAWIRAQSASNEFAQSTLSSFGSANSFLTTTGFNTTTGEVYTVKFDYSQVNLLGIGLYGGLNVTAPGTTVTYTSSGAQSFDFTATGSSSTVQFRATVLTASYRFRIDNIVVTRKVPELDLRSGSGALWVSLLMIALASHRRSLIPRY